VCDACSFKEKPVIQRKRSWDVWSPLPPPSPRGVTSFSQRPNLDYICGSRRITHGTTKSVVDIGCVRGSTTVEEPNLFWLQFWATHTRYHLYQRPALCSPRIAQCCSRFLHAFSKSQQSTVSLYKIASPKLYSYITTQPRGGSTSSSVSYSYCRGFRRLNHSLFCSAFRGLAVSGSWLPPSYVPASCLPRSARASPASPHPRSNSSLKLTNILSLRAEGVP
jgi:hypothetical protein